MKRTIQEIIGAARLASLFADLEKNWDTALQDGFIGRTQAQNKPWSKRQVFDSLVKSFEKKLLMQFDKNLEGVTVDAIKLESHSHETCFATLHGEEYEVHICGATHLVGTARKPRLALHGGRIAKLKVFHVFIGKTFYQYRSYKS